jgi:hypothetical protein
MAGLSFAQQQGVEGIGIAHKEPQQRRQGPRERTCNANRVGGSLLSPGTTAPQAKRSN